MFGSATARRQRLLAAREFANECIQQVELQENASLEDRTIGSLSTIVLEAIDCLRSDQPFRSSNLQMLTVDMLACSRQDRPTIVSFGCAFTMLMSELLGIDLAERGGPRSYSNSIPDVQSEVAATAAAAAPLQQQQRLQSPMRPSTARTLAPSSSSATSVSAIHHRPAAKLAKTSPAPRSAAGPAAAAAAAAAAPDSPLFRMKEEEPEEDEDGRQSEEYEDTGVNGSLAGALQGAGQFDASMDDMSFDNSIGTDLLQRMFATNTMPGSSQVDPLRSEIARNQAKNKSGRFESRDNELAVIHGLPLSASEIENLPDQEMARYMRSEDLTEMQKNVMKQIRKRARSKISSREYRKRKAQNIITLTTALQEAVKDDSHSSYHNPDDQQDLFAYSQFDGNSS